MDPMRALGPRNYLDSTAFQRDLGIVVLVVLAAAVLFTQIAVKASVSSRAFRWANKGG